MNQPVFHHENVTRVVCCRCLEAIFKQNKTHSSMWDPDGHTLSFRSSWWRLDVEVVGFSDGKKPDGNFGKKQLWSSKKSLLSKQNPMTHPLDWYIFLLTWKPWKSRIHVGIPYYGLYKIVSHPKKKVIEKYSRHRPEKTICVDPFLSYLLVSARHLFWPKTWALAVQWFFENPGQTPYIGVLMMESLIMGVDRPDCTVDLGTPYNLVNQSWRPIQGFPNQEHGSWFTWHGLRLTSNPS